MRNRATDVMDLVHSPTMEFDRLLGILYKKKVLTLDEWAEIRAVDKETVIRDANYE